MLSSKTGGWLLCRLLFLTLSIIAFTPLVVPESHFEPMFLGVPLTLWAGMVIAVSFVALASIGAKVHPGEESRDRDSQ